MKIVVLDRQFLEWNEKDPAAADLYAAFSGWSYAIGWADVREKSRVVILAEAGSGKTIELKEQARALAAEGRYAFYATVQDVAKEGLSLALSAAECAKFDEWKSTDQVAWLFIDSIDEAKLDGLRLERALQHIADAIEGVRSRARIVLSGRYSDWEFRADLARLADVLPVPRVKPKPEPPTPDSALRAILRGDRQKQVADNPEQPFIALMAPLDAGRIRRFAAENGIVRREEFMAAIDAANLWRFARRPLDLQWLVAYWKANGRFGSLTEMIEASLTERLREPNAKYVRTDPLQADRAMEALERIGAAFVFGRMDKLLVPDTELSLDGTADFDLAGILPDWSPEHRQRLLTRAVFDPDTFGRVRLHNDNEGTVRSYLAARWLTKRRLRTPIRDILPLLFAEKYGVLLVKPSARQTAAWLSIWEPDVAREVISRDPLLLFNYGDPGRLPLAVRQKAVAALVARLVDTGERLGGFEEDALRRFSTEDMASQIRALWDVHKANAEVRVLVLKMIASGRLRSCADIAGEAVYGDFANERTIYLGGRALLAAEDDAGKHKYARYIVNHASELPSIAVWEALDRLFPVEIGVPVFLEMISNMVESERSDTLGLGYHGPRLVSRVLSRENLELLLSGLLAQLGPSPSAFGTMETPAEKAYLPPIVAAAHALLEAATSDEAPAVAIDATIRVQAARYYRNATTDMALLTADLGSSKQRRELAFWHAVKKIAGHPFLDGKPLQSAWQLSVIGWSPRLQLDDLDWLLRDATTRGSEAERHLAFRSAIETWRTNASPEGALAKIREVARLSPLLQQQLDTSLAPHEPSEQERLIERQAEEARKRHTDAQAERDRSWSDFLSGVRANPNQLRNPTAATAETVDGRLYHLWKLLESMDEGGSRYGIDDVRPLETLLGSEATAAFCDGMVTLWRQRAPTLKSSRAPDKRNITNAIDCMGITAISIEAQRTTDWTSTLTAEDARKATAYATLELNGFPAWLAQLAARWPREVGEVLFDEIRSEIHDPSTTLGFAVLGRVARVAAPIAATVAKQLFVEISIAEQFPTPSLGATLDAIVLGLGGRDREIVDVFLSKFGSSESNDASALYLAASFRVDPARAMTTLASKLDALCPADQTRLVQRLLPTLFGDRLFNEGVDLASLPPELVKRLLLLAFRTIRPEEDNRHPSGEMYSPDERDHAERVRNALFTRFVDTPGRAVFESLREMAEIDGFPVLPQRLMEIARTRAEADAEAAPWLPDEAYRLEQQFDTAPRSPADLQLAVIRRLSDIQHDLLNSDFAQGATLQSLPDEPAVQIWVAKELQTQGGRAYSVERKSHVVEEKAPDIRLRAKASDASLPIEIKIAESWTREELEVALTIQLNGRYLRDQDARHGIMLLVHQQARAKGWKRDDETFMTFPELVFHLQTIANRLASVFDGPQVQIPVLDVSTAGKTPSR